LRPPTLAKWQLGKQLFFDDGWLRPAGGRKEACVTCHNPDSGYTETSFARLNAPTLINCVYNPHQFWDGRVPALEEVVQRTLEDEREPAAGNPAPYHVWSGVIERLRKHKDYPKRFREAFGTEPTQDAVGKALATYLRTVLSGNAVHDRAEQARKARGGSALQARDYEKALDGAAIKALRAERNKPAEVAKDLFTGYRLFRGKARCVHCHGGHNFTDNGFHNLGVGESSLDFPPGNEPGRFKVVPPGLKDPRLIGAFKTPTLRALPRTAPYFHDGSRSDLRGDEALFQVVAFHVKGGNMNAHLDPELRDPKDPGQRRDLGLKEDEVRAVVLFLKALDGEEVDPVVSSRPK
jgi:cytochrome c peroxidase